MYSSTSGDPCDEVTLDLIWNSEKHERLLWKGIHFVLHEDPSFLTVLVSDVVHCLFMSISNGICHRSSWKIVLGSTQPSRRPTSDTRLCIPSWLNVCYIYWSFFTDSFSDCAAFLALCLAAASQAMAIKTRTSPTHWRRTMTCS